MVAVRGSEAERQAEHSSFVSVLLLLETYRSDFSGNRAEERDLIAESQGSAFNGWDYSYAASTQAGSSS